MRSILTFLLFLGASSAAATGIAVGVVEWRGDRGDAQSIEERLAVLEAQYDQLSENLEALLAAAQNASPPPTRPPLFQLGSTRDNPVPVGQSLLLPTGWELTVIGVATDVTQFMTPTGPSELAPPRVGHHHIVVRARVVNVSAGDPATPQLSIGDVGLVGSSAVLYDHAWPGPPPGLAATIFEGATLEGDIPFSNIPDNETGLLLMIKQGDARRFFALE